MGEAAGIWVIVIWEFIPEGPHGKKSSTHPVYWLTTDMDLHVNVMAAWQVFGGQRKGDMGWEPIWWH